MKATKKIISVLLSFILVTTAFTAFPFSVSAAETGLESVSASSGTTGDCTWTLDDNGTLIISGNGEMQHYGQVGSEIEAPWRYSVVHAIIQDGVTSIGDCAFYMCRNLESVIIPNSVTSIWVDAFQYCDKLTSITIPESVTYIKEAAFGNCKALKSITVDSNNKTYDSRNNCNAIIETATNTLVAGTYSTIIPHTVTKIGDYAFYYSNLKSITIPSSINSIGYKAFANCPLTTIIVDENNSIFDSRNNCNAIIETKTNSLLVGCNNTIIPDSVTTIGRRAFSYTSITNISIPSGVTNIENSAFWFCESLETITIPNTVKKLEIMLLKSVKSLILLDMVVHMLKYTQTRKEFLSYRWYDRILQF